MRARDEDKSQQLSESNFQNAFSGLVHNVHVFLSLVPVFLSLVHVKLANYLYFCYNNMIYLGVLLNIAFMA